MAALIGYDTYQRLEIKGSLLKYRCISDAGHYLNMQNILNMWKMNID